MAGDTFFDSHTRPFARCDLCGGPVTRHSSDEGTQSATAVREVLTFKDADRPDLVTLRQELRLCYDQAVAQLERAERAEAERDEARAALRALLGALITGKTTIEIRQADVTAARKMVEGWGDA